MTRPPPAAPSAYLPAGLHRADQIEVIGVPVPYCGETPPRPTERQDARNGLRLGGSCGECSGPPRRYTAHEVAILEASRCRT